MSEESRRIFEINSGLGCSDNLTHQSAKYDSRAIGYEEALELADQVERLETQLTTLQAEKENWERQARTMAKAADNEKANAKELQAEIERLKDWPIGLRVSMAMRLRHDFGLLRDEQKRIVLEDVNRIWEEFSGHGFYKPENKENYPRILSDPKACLERGRRLNKLIDDNHPLALAGIICDLQAEKERLEGELGRLKPIMEAAELYYLAMQACEKSGNDGADVNDVTDSLNSLLFCAALYFDPTQEPTNG